MHEEARFELRISQEFIEALARIYSKRLIDHIKGILETLQMSPEIGSTCVRDCLTGRHGEGIRKIPVSTFVIIYRFNGEMVDVETVDVETVDVLALVCGPSIA